MNILLKNINALINEKEILIIKKCDIYIKDDSIISIDSMPDEYKVEETVDGTNKLVIPGLINCHTHAYMSLFRNIADDVDFDTWLFKKIMPIEDNMTSEDAYYGGLLGMIEMIKTGTTTFVDMHMHKGMSIKAAKELGIRAVISRGLAGGDRNDPGSIRRLNEARDEIDNNDDSKITFAIGPHAIYTCGEDYIRQAIEVAKEKSVMLNVHLSETKNEVENCIKEHGCTPVKYLDNLGFFDVNALAAHCVYVTDEDIEILKDKKVNVVTNPCSNMKLGNGFAPIPKMINKGINICLGTDGAGSNNSLNMFNEMQMLSMIHKGLEKDSTVMSAVDTLKIGTVNGAKALKLDDKIGKIEKGMKADLCILDLENPQSNPQNNLLSALVYSMNGSEVESVIINGEFVLKDKKICFVDEKKVYYKTNEIMKKFL